MAAVRVEVGSEPGTKGNPLLPLAVVAKRIGAHSKKTVTRLIQRGVFPGVQWSGGKLVIPEQEVLAYLRKQRERPVTLLRS